MKKLIAVIAAVMFVFLGIVPAFAADVVASNPQTMYVDSANGGTVRARTLPSKDGKVINNLGVGRPVTVISAYDSEWSEISYKVNGTTKHGYMMTKFLTDKDPAAKNQTFRDVKEDVFLKVMPASANGVVSLWNRTSKRNCDKVRDLDRDENMLVISESHAWYLVSANDGEVGYVAKAYVTK